MQKNILGAIFCRMKGEPFEVTYWDGKTEKYGSDNNREPLFRIIINTDFRFDFNRHSV